MTNVGFPLGLPIGRQEIRELLARVDGQGVFGHYLVVELLSNGHEIGECKMYLPDEEGISRTDVKLLPEYWGHRYGVEVKQALVDYLFTHTTCDAVEGTPNVDNLASIKMQEAVGAIRVGESVFHHEPSKAGYTKPVHHYIYLVYRSTWETKRHHS